MNTTLSIQEAREQLEGNRPELERVEDRAREVTREPLVYQLDEPRSFFADSGLALTTNEGASEAREHLEKHRRQMVDVAKHRETREVPGTIFEYRINPNMETGHGGEFAPPLWANEQFATARRTGPIVQKMVAEAGGMFALPHGVSSVNLPRVTVGTTNDVNYPGSPEDSSDVLTEPASSPAEIFSGISDWSLQALEQSPKGAYLDWAMQKDMHESVDFNIERKVITGEGSAYEEWMGLYKLTGTNEVLFTAGSPKGTELVLEIAKALAQVGLKRRRPPTALLMSTPRFYWLASSHDLQERPLVLEDYPHSVFPNAGFMSVGVYLDDAIQNVYNNPSVMGGEQDAIFAFRPDDMIMYESQPTFSTFTDVLSGTLQVRFRMHRTVAAILGRYPSGISKVVGTGMTVQTGFK